MRRRTTTKRCGQLTAEADTAFSAADCLPLSADHFDVGLRATTMYIGVKIPSAPPAASPSAPLHSVRWTTTDPRGARRIVSSTTSITWVSQRPTDVPLRSDSVHFGCNAEYQGTTESSARSRYSTISSPAARTAAWNAAMPTTSGTPLPTYTWSHFEWNSNIPELREFNQTYK